MFWISNPLTRKLTPLSKLQKELASIYFQRLQWIQQLKKDAVHKKIMQTKNALVNDHDFDPEEAMEAAVNKKKFLIKRRKMR